MFRAKLQAWWSSRVPTGTTQVCPWEILFCKFQVFSKKKYMFVFNGFTVPPKKSVFFFMFYRRASHIRLELSRVYGFGFRILRPGARKRTIIFHEMNYFYVFIKLLIVLNSTERARKYLIRWSSTFNSFPDIH